MTRVGQWIVAGSLLVSPCMAHDAREPAVRTEAEREFILGQMRLFLQSTQAITAALAKNELDAVAAEATARGRKGTPLSEIPPGLKAKETPEWTAMMGRARAGFDDIAKAARDGAPTSELLGTLGETMSNCVACHQSYRLATELKRACNRSASPDPFARLGVPGLDSKACYPVCPFLRP